MVILNLYKLCADLLHKPATHYILVIVMIYYDVLVGTRALHG